MSDWTVDWIDAGREPQFPPNPAYPKGIDLDLSSGAMIACIKNLPYPAKRCGHYLITCKTCGNRIVVTTAGRPDDPRSVKIACKLVKPGH
jgi:hypothetical protein